MAGSQNDRRHLHTARLALGLYSWHQTRLWHLDCTWKQGCTSNLWLLQTWKITRGKKKIVIRCFPEHHPTVYHSWVKTLRCLSAQARLAAILTRLVLVGASGTSTRAWPVVQTNATMGLGMADLYSKRLWKALGIHNRSTSNKSPKTFQGRFTGLKLNPICACCWGTYVPMAERWPLERPMFSA